MEGTGSGSLWRSGATFLRRKFRKITDYETTESIIIIVVVVGISILVYALTKLRSIFSRI